MLDVFALLEEPRIGGVEDSRFVRLGGIVVNLASETCVVLLANCGLIVFKEDCNALNDNLCMRDPDSNIWKDAKMGGRVCS